MARYTFGGDEHLFVEVAEAMSLDAFFKNLSMTRILSERAVAMDRFALRAANLLVGNEEGAAALEAASSGPSSFFAPIQRSP